MADNTIQTSFAGGELSPALYARTDLAKFEVGAALLRNVIVDYRGGAFNRPGTEFIADLSLLTPPFRLIPFVVSQQASYVLVFSDLLVSIFHEGIPVTAVITPYAGEDLNKLKYAQSADVLTLTHPDYPPANLTRTDDTTFDYDVIVTGPKLFSPVLYGMRAPHSGPYNYGYLITAIDVDGKEESMPSNPGVKHSEAMDEKTNRVIGLTWTAPAVTPASRYNIFKWGPIDAVTMVAATTWGFIGTAQTTTFSDNNIAPDYAKQPPQWGDPFSGGQILAVTVTSPGSGYDGTSDWGNIPYIYLSITGDGTGAAGYAVIDPDSGTIVGAFMTYPGKNYTTATITADDYGGSGATFEAAFSDPEPLYPACVSYLQQRRVYAGSDEKPATFIMSQPGLFDNFNVTPVTLATDAISATISSLQVNAIRSMVPVSYGLLAFTSGGCYLIGSSEGPQGGISPETISVTQQASPGANDLPPLLVNYDVVFGQNKGNRLLRAAFAWERQSFTTADITQYAPHLFDNYRTVDWCFAEVPHKLIWLVRDDGKLLTCAYVPEQEVYAWTRSDTQGQFTSICSVPEDDTDAVYVIVERYLPPLVPFVPGGGGEPVPVERTVELTRIGRPGPWCGGAFIGTTLSVVNLCGTLGVGDVLWATNFDGDGSVTIVATPGTADGLGFYTITPDQGTNEPFYAGTLFGLVVGDVLTVMAAGPNDLMEVGTVLYGAGVPANTYITAFLTGSGGTGTYRVSTDTGAMVAGTPLEVRYGWLVPEDWSETNLVECLGAGGNGGDGLVGLSRGGGGGGSGGYASQTITGLTPGSYVPYQVGHPFAGDGADPLFGNASGFNVQYGSADGTNAVWARGGGHGDGTGFGNGGIGGPIDWGDTNPQPGSKGGEGFDDPLGPFTAASGGGGGGAPWITAGNVGADGTDQIGGDGGDATDAGTLGGAGADESPAEDGEDGTGLPTLGPGAGGGAGNNFYKSGGDAGSWGGGGGGAGHKDDDTNGFGGDGGDGYVLITYMGLEPPPTGVCEPYNVGPYLERFDPRLETCLTRAWFLDSALQIPLHPGDGEFAIVPTDAGFDLVYCDDEVGHTFEVGDVVLIGCAQITITSIVNMTSYTVSVSGSLEPYRIPDDPDGTFRLISADMWEWVTPVSAVSGLDHLENAEVYALCDGRVEGPYTVTDGGITLEAPAAIITVGLKFTSQWKTLYLTAEGIQRGSEQGKRKNLQGVTLRVDNSRGLQVGPAFDALTDIPELILAGTTDTYTGDAYTTIQPDWNTKGEVCVEQTLPLPASVLGVIVGVTAGDTGR